MARSFWVIMQKRSDDKVYADLHKTNDTIYHTQDDAKRVHGYMNLASLCHVVELVALTREEWEELGGK